MNRLKNQKQKTGSKFLNNQPFNVYLKNHHIIRTQIHYLRFKIIRESSRIHECLGTLKKKLQFYANFQQYSVFSSDKSTRHDQLKKKARNKYIHLFNFHVEGTHTKIISKDQ